MNEHFDEDLFRGSLLRRPKHIDRQRLLGIEHFRFDHLGEFLQNSKLFN